MIEDINIKLENELNSPKQNTWRVQTGCSEHFDILLRIDNDHIKLF